MVSRLSIRTKIALLMTVLLAIVSIAIYWYFPARLHRQIVEAVAQKSAALTGMTAFSLGAGLDARSEPAIAAALSSVRANDDLVYLMLLDDRGEVFASFNERIAGQSRYQTLPMDIIAAPQRVVQAGERQARSASTAVWGGASGDGTVYQSMSPVRHRGRRVGRLYTGLSLMKANADARKSRATIALVTLLAFFVVTAAVFALSTLITGPLQRIVDTSEEIAAGDFSKRALVGSSDEVGQLARSFNTMVDRVEEWNRTLEARVDERTRALRMSEERYRLLFERNHAGVYIAAEDGRVLDCNDACARIFRYDSRADFLESGTVAYIQPHHRDSIIRRLREEGTVTNEEVELRACHDEGVWALENVRRIPPHDGEPAVLEGILLDITERKRAEAEIAFKAYHDALTQLPNRSLFLDRLEVALAHAHRNDASLAVLFLDLDGMKAINDTFGHSTGDRVLKIIAARLVESVRGGDTVARAGGDEFLVALNEVGDTRDAERIAAKILAHLAVPLAVDQDELFVTSSIGVALYPADADDAEMLIRAADAAMYRVKELGGNAVQLSSRSGKRVPGRLSLEEQIRVALDRDEFVVHYQPQVHLGTRALSGAEALVRWQRPDGALVGPAAFMRVCEQTGLICALGEMVLIKACRQMVDWDRTGNAPARMAVNVSARQFYQRDFSGMVDRALASTGLAPHRLELEITETLAMQTTDRSLATLRQFREMGISIAVDDFGTGQASLSYLKRFPVDTVKIDQSFVHDLVIGDHDEWIVTAVLMLANHLGLRTIAEGVETEEQYRFLHAHDCREIQGYLISRPLAPAAFADAFLVRREGDREPLALSG